MFATTAAACMPRMALGALILASAATAQNTIPCTGPVQHNLQWGTQDDYAMADSICCHNSFYAEPFGATPTL